MRAIHARFASCCVLLMGYCLQVHAENLAELETKTMALKLSKDAKNKIVSAVIGDAEVKAANNPLTAEKIEPVQLEEIRVLGLAERQVREKSPIEKMRSVLDQHGQSRTDSVVESMAADGARYAQVNQGSRIYCIEERRGLIDFSGINEKPLVTSVAGTKCRRGQY